jgi:hypothetical protein
VSAGDAVRAELKKEGIEPTGYALHKKSEELTEKMSGEEFIDWFIENTPQIDWHKGPILIDGIRRPGNHKRLQELYPGRNILVHLDTSEGLRLKRVVGRGRDHITSEQITTHLSHPVEKDYPAYFRKNADYVVTEGEGLDEVIDSLILLVRKS